MGALPLRRVRGPATAIVVLLPFVAVLNVAFALANGAAADAARSYLDAVENDRPSDLLRDEFLDATLPATAAQALQGLAMIGAAIVTMIWMHRLASNHRALGRVGTWGPGWAVGSWFLPPLILFVLPMLMLRELWRASDPAVPIGGNWRSGPASPLTIVWWLFFGVAPLVILGIQGTSFFDSLSLDVDDEATARLFIDQQETAWFNAAITVGAASAFVLLVLRLTDRHRRLTGEATAPAR